MRHASVPRRLLLVGLVLVTAFGCIVPSVFHDTWWRVERYAGSGCCGPCIDAPRAVRHSRNRLTGDVLQDRIRWWPW